jgi:hypothetical protein
MRSARRVSRARGDLDSVILGRPRQALRHTGSVPLLLAHIGHWYMWLLYALPAFIVLGATLHSARAQRKARRQGPGGAG